MTFITLFRAHFIGRVATLGIATFFSAVLSIALLPIATKSLHASDYGTYALLTSIIILVSSAMDGGSPLFLPAVYYRGSPRERARMFVTSAIIAASGGSVICITALAVERYFHTPSFEFQIPLDAMLIAAVTVPLRSVAAITTVIFSITNRSYAIAIQTLLQAVCVFVFTIIGLFCLALGGTALLFGAASGQLAALAVGLLILNKHGELVARPSLRFARRALRHALTSSTSGFVGGAHNFAENSLLAAAKGLQAAGFISHARVYYNFTLALIGTVGHNVRAASLEEARNLHSHFEATRKAWVPVHVALTCAGLFFALFGGEVVDLISNGKLTDAAPYIPYFLIIALLQNSDQASTATVYAFGKAYIAARIQIALAISGLLALFPLIHVFGMAGIVIAIIAETILYRIQLAKVARRLRSVPFHDGAAYFGCALVAMTAAGVDLAAPSLQARAACMIAGLILVGFVGRRSIAEISAEIQGLRLGARTEDPDSQVDRQP